MHKPPTKYSWLRRLPSSAALIQAIDESAGAGAVSQGTATNYILHWSAFLMWLAGEERISVDPADGTLHREAPREGAPADALDTAARSCTAADVNRYLAELAGVMKIQSVRTMAASLRAAFRALKPVLGLAIDPDEIKAPSAVEGQDLPVFETWSAAQTPGAAHAQRRTGVRKYVAYVKDSQEIEVDAAKEQAALDSAIGEAAAKRPLTPEWAHADTLTGTLLLKAKELFDAYAAAHLENSDIKGMLSSIRGFYRWAVLSGFIVLDIDYELINPANEKMTRGRRRISMEGGRTLDKIERERAPRPPRKPRAERPVREPPAPASPAPPDPPPPVPAPAEPIASEPTASEPPPSPSLEAHAVRRVSLGDSRIKNVILPRNAVVDELIRNGDPRLTFGDLVELRSGDVRLVESRIFVRRLELEIPLAETALPILTGYDTALRSTKLFEHRLALGTDAPYLMSADGGLLTADDVEESGEMPSKFFEMRNALLEAFMRRLKIPFWTLVWLPFTHAPDSMPILNLRSGTVPIPSDLAALLRQYRQIVRSTHLKNYWNSSMTNTPLLPAPDGGPITADTIR